MCVTVPEDGGASSAQRSAGTVLDFPAFKGGKSNEFTLFAFPGSSSFPFGAFKVHVGCFRRVSVPLNRYVLNLITWGV